MNKQDLVPDLSEEDLAKDPLTLFAGRILPVDPYEYRLITSRICLNVGEIAHAMNTKQLSFAVKRYSPEKAVKLQWEVESYAQLYPEENAREGHRPYQTVWPLFRHTPLIVIEDAEHKRWLLDGGMRLRMAAHFGERSVCAHVISLADALRFGGADDEFVNITRFKKLPGERAATFAGAMVYGQGPVAALPAPLESDPDDRSLEILEWVFIELFFVYFEKHAEATGVKYGQDYQKTTKERYDALSYEGLPIFKRRSFETVYNNHKVDARRYAYNLAKNEPPSDHQVLVRNWDEQAILRLLYVLGIVIKQVVAYDRFVSDRAKKPNDRLLLDRFMLATQQQEDAAGVALVQAGVPPINIVDFLGIAQATGINAARYYPGRQRMQGVLDWMCAWYAEMYGQKLVTPIMRAQLAYRTFVTLSGGGDGRSFDWTMLLAPRSQRANTILIHDCWLDLLSADPVLAYFLKLANAPN